MTVKKDWKPILRKYNAENGTEIKGVGAMLYNEKERLGTWKNVADFFGVSPALIYYAKKNRVEIPEVQEKEVGPVKLPGMSALLGYDVYMPEVVPWKIAKPELRGSRA